MPFDDRGPAVFSVTLALCIIATIFVAARLVSKGWVVGKFTSDDWFTVVAWVFSTAVSITIMIGTQVGLGKPDESILPAWGEPLKRSIYAFTVFYNPALMATKTAILLLYRRMAAAHPFLRYASIGTLVVVNVAGVVLTALSVFQCRPIYAAFSDNDGECIDVVSLYLSSAPINILTDLAILCLPLPILTQLRMEFKQKFALVCTFAVGAFVTIVDVIRIIYLQDALRQEREFDDSAMITASTRPPNFTYYASFSLMWSAIEVSVGLMCCCVLVLKPLIMRVMPGFLGGTKSRRGSRYAASSPDSGLVSDISSKDPRSPDSIQSSQLPMPITPNLESANTLGFSALTLDDVSRSPKANQKPIQELNGNGLNGFLGLQGDGEDDDDDDGMDFFQMLASDPPTSEAGAPLASSTQEQSPTRRRSLIRRATMLATGRPTVERSPVREPVQEPTHNFFDFVNMKGKTPLTQLSRKEAWWPILFVSILFFLWGFAYGLLGTLNGQIQSLLHYSPSATFALHNAYWIGYFLGPPLVGYWTLTREGFKATFIAGLAIYACGAMSFWPSSVLKSYPGFFVSNFIVALGLSVLENAANPFIALAGPGELMEVRLCFSQGIQGVGSVISPILANKALFSGIDEEDLFRLQYCYLAVALFVVTLAVIFFYVPLSEASDDELEAMATQRLYNADLEQTDKAYGFPARTLLLWSGVVMMSTYVGAQEAVSYFWGYVISGTNPGYDAFNALGIGYGLFAFGRFLGAGLCYIAPPRYVLFGYIFGSFLCSILAMVLPQGPTAMSFIILLLFFESAIFPILYAMILRGQGKHTKFAATVVTMAICGGAVWPSVTYGVDMIRPDDPRYAIRVTIGLYAVAMLWPILLSANRVMRRWLDPIWSVQRLAVAGETGQTTMVDWATPASGHSKTLATHVEVSEPAETEPWETGAPMTTEASEQTPSVEDGEGENGAAGGGGGGGLRGGLRRLTGMPGRQRKLSVTFDKQEKG